MKNLPKRKYAIQLSVAMVGIYSGYFFGKQFQKHNVSHKEESHHLAAKESPPGNKSLSNLREEMERAEDKGDNLYGTVKLFLNSKHGREQITDFLKTFPLNGNHQSPPYGVIIAVLVKEAPGLLVDCLIDNDNLRQAAARSILIELGVYYPAEATRFIDSLPISDQNQFIESLLIGWVKQNPMEAIAYAKSKNWDIPVSSKINAIASSLQYSPELLLNNEFISEILVDNSMLHRLDDALAEVTLDSNRDPTKTAALIWEKALSQLFGPGDEFRLDNFAESKITRLPSAGCLMGLVNNLTSIDEEPLRAYLKTVPASALKTLSPYLAKSLTDKFGIVQVKERERGNRPFQAKLRGGTRSSGRVSGCRVQGMGPDPDSLEAREQEANDLCVWHSRFPSRASSENRRSPMASDSGTAGVPGGHTPPRSFASSNSVRKQVADL